MMNDSEKVFVDIYKKHFWKSASRSGPGSDPRKVAPYANMLQEFINDPINRVDSIVDLGCGDWAWARRLKFGGRSYVGLDVVPEMVSELRRKYGSDTVRFMVTDSAWKNLPEGDLLLVKDVLQHLPHERIKSFVDHVLPRYRLTIITNDVARFHLRWWPLPWPRASVGIPNTDIPDGEWRPLNVLLPPYSLAATPLLTFDVNVTVRTLDVKQSVLHVSTTTGAQLAGSRR